MEVDEIWKAMLYEINDIEVLKDACQNNEIANTVCSNKLFWLKYFQNNNVSMIDVNYNTSIDWIEEFVFSRIKFKETDNLIRYLYNNKNRAIEFHHWIDIKNKYSFLMLQDKTLNKILDTYLIENNGKRIVATIRFDGEYYLLDYHNDMIFDLSSSDVKRYIFQILYNNHIIDKK